MNEQLQAQLTQLLASLLSVASEAGGFARAQALPLIEEKLHVDMVLSCAGVFLGLVLCVIAGSAWKTKDTIESDALLIVGFMCAVVGPMMVAVNTYWAIYISLAPRLYIVEWLRGML